jgi:hypothetical protein
MDQADFFQDPQCRGQLGPNRGGLIPRQARFPRHLLLERHPRRNFADDKRMVGQGYRFQRPDQCGVRRRRQFLRSITPGLPQRLSFG